MKNYIQNIMNEPILKRFTGGAFAALLITAVSAILTFGVQIFMARLLGVYQFGHYMLAISWMHIITTIAVLGLNGISVKYINAYRTKKQWRLLKGSFRFGLYLCLISGLVFGLLSVLIIVLMKGHFELELYKTFLVMAALVPIRSFTMLQFSWLRSLQKIILSMAPEMILRLMFLSVFAYLGSHILDGQFTASWALGAFLASNICVSLIYVFITPFALPKELKGKKPAYETKEWFVACLFFVVSAGMNILMRKTDMVVIGIYLDPSHTGIYGAVSNITSLLLMGYAAINMIFGPIVSELYNAKNYQKLWRTFYVSRNLQVLGFGVGALVLTFAGEWVLSFFGPVFVVGHQAMLILAWGLFVSSIAGSSVYMATMSHMHKETALISVLAVLFNIALNFILVPKYGLNGAAFSTVISWALLQFLSLYIVHKRVEKS